MDKKKENECILLARSLCIFTACHNLVESCLVADPRDRPTGSCTCVKKHELAFELGAQLTKRKLRPNAFTDIADQAHNRA